MEVAEPAIEARDTELCGIGLFATRDIEKGELVCTDEYGWATTKTSSPWVNYRLLQDLNHSCTPNVRVVREFKDMYRLEQSMYALCDIAEGEEVFDMYMFRDAKVPTMISSFDRMTALFHAFGFVCMCLSCTDFSTVTLMPAWEALPVDKPLPPTLPEFVDYPLEDVVVLDLS